MLKAELKGTDALYRNLMDLADVIRDEATRAGLHSACQVVSDAYVLTLPAGTEVKAKPRIRQTVAYKIWPYPDKSGMAGIVGTKSGMAPHAHLIEDGTKYRFRTKFGIGGHFRFMMMKEYWNNLPASNPRKWTGTIRKGSWDGHLLRPGDPKTRAGTMPAFHSLSRAGAMSESKAAEAFTTSFQRVIAKPIKYR